MRRWALIVGLLAFAGLFGGVAGYALYAPPPAKANARELHTLLHIGCQHHNHGPKWHQDHGRILGAKSRERADE